MIEYRILGMKSNMSYAEAGANFEKMVKDLSLPADRFNTTLRVIKIEYESDEYRNISAIAVKYGFKAYEHTYKVEYTKKELSEAKFFEVNLSIYGKADYTEGYQTKYKDFYCKSCCAHQLIPEGVIYINKTEFRGKDIAVSMKLNNEIIVSNKMKELIENMNMTGVNFFPAYHYNNRLKNDYLAWHMVVTNVIPKIDSSMPMYIMDNYCSVCKRHHVLPLSYVRYTKSELVKVNDFNLSSEMFGNGWYGSPKLIVSHNVYDLIINNRIKGCKFEIVGII